MVRDSVDVSKALRKIARAEQKIKEGIELTTNELALLGKDYARLLAPNNTGKTASFIVIYKKGRNKRQIKAKNPTLGGAHKNLGTGKYGSNFNLVRWMHETGGIFRSPNPFQTRRQSHIKSGDARFMYKTRDYLNSIKKGVAKGRFRNINIGG